GLKNQYFKSFNGLSRVTVEYPFFADNQPLTLHAPNPERYLILGERCWGSLRGSPLKFEETKGENRQQEKIESGAKRLRGFGGNAPQ
ncbi:MAG: hypothetical protein II019_03750, partial [Bacteroidales bacterium]|nr:hypothetical protein [Bacteroidales bacterium]